MIVGTAGHVDHGKTALVRALTGVDTDRLPEEKKRGITIDLGFAYRPTPDGDVIGFVDVPGHEKFVGTMAAGAAGIDLLLLVVAADDGVMPQTREHLAIAELLGLERALVALSKADLASPERRAAVSGEIAAALAGTALAGAPIVPVSTLTGEGIAALSARLDEETRQLVAHEDARRFRLSVDRSFSLPGAGTIVTGTVLSGTVATGDRVMISPKGTPARVRSIHAGNRPAERGRAGERCALNLAGIDRDAASRGDVVLDPSLHAPAERIDALVRLLPSEAKPVGTWLPVHLHHGAATATARLVPLSSDTIAPGAQGFAQLVLDRPVAATVGDRFVLRDTSARRTIGGGRFLDLRAPARKRRTPERLAQLGASREIEPARALARLLECPPFFVDLTGFGRDRALDPVQLDEVATRLGCARLPVGDRVVVLARACWRVFGRALADALAAFHADNPDLQGIGAERLRLGLAPRLPREVFKAALAALVAEDAAVVEGSFVRLPGHVARMTEADEALWAKVEPLLAQPAARFRPPRVRDVAGILGAPEAEVRRLCKLAGRMGRVDEIAHDHFFVRSTTAEMAGIVRRLTSNEDRTFTAAAFRDEVDNGRKVAIQVLEYFDRHGVTIRRGDLRRLNPHRADLFGEAPPPAKF